VRADQDEQGKPCSQTARGVTPSPAMRPTVLMVDDHDGFRARARVMLEDAGFDVVGEAADAAAGIAAAERLRPDVVLLDIGLPDEDGFAVASRLRDDGTAARIVLISGRQAEDYGGRVERSAADGFIAKLDLTPERLLE